MKTEQLHHIFLNSEGVNTDTRSIKNGQLYFALKGENFNGNHYVQQAIEKGASACIIDEVEFATNDNKTILVEDVLTALQDLSKFHRTYIDIPVIAITGSNGKTTTKELVNAVLSSSYNVCCTVGNLNNHIGVPLTLLKLRKEHQLAIVEMGANHCGEIASYCQWALPNIGIITNIGKAHLEGFGGIEGVIRGKTELYDFIRSNGGAVFVNSNDALLMEKSNGIKRYEYGGSEGNFIYKISNSNTEFISVQYSENGNSEDVASQMTGAYNFSNIALAIALGRYFSIDIIKIKNAIAAYAPDNSRSQLIKKENMSIILDAYNANPSSMEVALKNLAQFNSTVKIAMLGGMKELGTESQEEHHKIVNLALDLKINTIVLVGPEFEQLAVEKGLLYFANSESAGQWFKTEKIDKACVLIKGSRATKMEKILE